MADKPDKLGGECTKHKKMEYTSKVEIPAHLIAHARTATGYSNKGPNLRRSEGGLKNVVSQRKKNKLTREPLVLTIIKIAV